MESYDTLLLGSLFGLPAFKQHFGEDFGGKAGYQIQPSWQAGMQQVCSQSVLKLRHTDMAGGQHGFNHRCLVRCGYC